MIPVLLTKIKTSDGITLDGIYIPPKRKSKIALIYLHGLTSKFYSGQTFIKELASRCRKTGVAYLKFNSRGHDIVTEEGPKEKKPLGTAFEDFSDCIFDIQSLIRYARKLGYKRIVLSGHSTGANKVLYYLYKTRDSSVKGLILLAPVSDTVYEQKKLGKKFWPILKEVRKLSRDPRRKHLLLPPELFTKHGVKPPLLNAERYLSLFSPGSKEDVFPYGNKNAGWKELRSIRIPLLIMVGTKDQYLDRPATEVITTFHKNAIRAQSFRGVAIKNAGHSLITKEKAFAEVIVSWIKKLNSGP